MSALDYAARAFYPAPVQQRPDGMYRARLNAAVRGYRDRSSVQPTGGKSARKGVKSRSFKVSSTFRRQRRAALGKRRSARSRSSKGSGKARSVQKARLLATVDSSVAMDRFHERLNFTVSQASTVTDQQLITMGSSVGCGGIDMRLMRNLRETINGYGAATTTDDPVRLLLYNHVRTITLRPVSTMTIQEVTMTRWRPRFDTIHTPVEIMAYASAGTGDYKTVNATTFGTTLFDSRIWTTAMKAVKSYKIILKPGFHKKMTFKRTFKKPKVIDYKGEWYYTLATRPSSALVDQQFYLKKELSEVITYTVKSLSQTGDGGGSVAIAAPGINIEDEQMLHYLRASTANLLKSNFESGASVAPVTIASGSRYGIPNGYHGYAQPISIVAGVVGV